MHGTHFRTNLGRNLLVLGGLWFVVQFFAFMIAEGPHGPKGEIQSALSQPGALVALVPSCLVIVVGLVIRRGSETKK